MPTNHHLNMPKSVAIIGAGPAGLCLANILLSHPEFNVQVFERDAHINVKPQGGSLDVHEDAQNALNAAGVYEQFTLHSRPEDQDDIILDRHSQKHIHMDGGEKNKPEIDRTALRQFLCDAVPEGIIKWDTKVDNVDPTTVYFKDGTSKTFDLIVGADGVWSKVRPLLHTISPFYSGVSCYEGNIRNASQKQSDFSDIICNGTTFVLAETDGLMVIQKNSGDCYKVYVYKSKHETWVRDSGIDKESGDALRAAMLDDIKDWSPKLHAVVKALDNDIYQRAMYMLPPGIIWESKPTVTVIGDAASVQTPFSGQGVNLALVEAYKLGQALVNHKDNQLLAIQEYEKWMYEEAKSKMTLTWSNLQMFMNKGAIEKLKIFVSH